MKAIFGISILAAMMALAGGVRAQSAGTNDTLLPAIELHEVPLHRAIDALARKANLNYLLDPISFPTEDTDGNKVKERIVTFRLENVSARATLLRLLEQYHLVLEEAPGSHIAIITRAGSALAKVPPTVNTTTNDGVIPLVEFWDVPMTTAIENLARQAGINYLIDPAVFPADAEGKPAREPLIDLRLTRVSAKDVLVRMLWVHGYVLMEDPVSNIAMITHANQSTNRLFAGISATAAKPQRLYRDTVDTNEVLPLIQFSEVPMTTAIENLARQEGVNYMIDPKVMRWWGHPGPDNTPEPMLNIRLEDVTAWNTLQRVLNLHNLVLVDNPVTHIWQVRGADEPPQKLDPSLLGLDTNNPATLTNGVIPLIQFSNVPLWDALENLIRQSSLPMTLDPRLKDEPISKMWLYVRWEKISAKQAIIAICQNNYLVIVTNAATGGLQIEPGPEWK